MKKQVLLVASLVLGVALLAGLGSFLLWAPDAFAEEVAALATGGRTDPGVQNWGYLAAALVTGMAALGQGMR